MTQLLEKTFANVHKFALFAVLFFFGTVTYFAKESIEPIYQKIYHYGFFSVCILLFFIFVLFDKLKPLMFLLNVFVFYIVLNYLRNNMLLESPLYYNLGILICINLSLLPTIAEAKVVGKQSFIILMAFLTELFFVEHLSKNEIIITTNFLLPAFVFGMFLFVYSSIKNQVLSYGFFFAFLCALLGYHYAFNTTGFTMFFGICLIICLASSGFYLYFNTFFEPTTKVKNKKAFLLYSKQKIIKCGLAIIYIDEINTLENKFNKANLNTLILLIANIIKEKHIKVFHINKSEFVIAFENTGADDAYEEVEKIRRKIATTDFILKGYKTPIKMTISAAIVERKRSDANVFDVFRRAEKLLSKTKNFNNNFTSKG